MKIKKLNLDYQKIDSNFQFKVLEESSKALKKINTKKKETAKIIEEAYQNKFKKRKQDRPDDNFVFELANKSKRKRAIEESVESLQTERFSSKRLEEKLELDLQYLKDLGEQNLVTESTKETYFKLLTEAISDVAKLHEEANLRPRKISLALDLDKSIEENEKIYKKHLIEKLEENFRKPLLTGKLIEENIEPAKKVIRIVIAKNLNDDLGDIDPAKMATVLPFLDTIKSHIREVMLPDLTMNKVQDFLSTQMPSYAAQPGNAIELLSSINDKLDKIACLLGNALFNSKIDLGDDSFDATPYVTSKIIADTVDDSDDIDTLDDDLNEPDPEVVKAVDKVTGDDDKPLNPKEIDKIAKEEEKDIEKDEE